MSRRRLGLMDEDDKDDVIEVFTPAIQERSLPWLQIQLYRRTPRRLPLSQEIWGSQASRRQKTCNKMLRKEETAQKLENLMIRCQPGWHIVSICRHRQKKRWPPNVVWAQGYHMFSKMTSWEPHCWLCLPSCSRVPFRTNSVCMHLWLIKRSVPLIHSTRACNPPVHLMDNEVTNALRAVEEGSIGQGNSSGLHIILDERSWNSWPVMVGPAGLWRSKQGSWEVNGQLKELKDCSEQSFLDLFNFVQSTFPVKQALRKEKNRTQPSLIVIFSVLSRGKQHWDKGTLW